MRVEFHWNTNVTAHRDGVGALRDSKNPVRHGDPRDRPIAVSEISARVNRETGQTRNPKYFAGGDCVNGGREVVDAVADGKRAALGIKKWLTQ